MHTDRANRIILGTFGLVMLAVGVAGLLASVGDFARRPLLDNAAGHAVGQRSTWFWPVTALAGLVIAGLALRWLVTVLFSTSRTGDIAVRGEATAGSAAGSTVLAAPALGEAVSEEIETYLGVRSVDAQVLGTPGDPRLAVAVQTDQTADLGALRHRIESQAFAHARQALDRPDLPIGLDFTVTRHHAARVR